MGRVEGMMSNSYGIKSDRVGASLKIKHENMSVDVEKKLLEHIDRHGSLKLEVGSGVRPKEGYLHLDMEFGVKKPHVEFSCDFMENNLPSDTFDEVLAVHFLEHVFWMNCPWAMAEFNRILKIGGKLFIEVPDYDVAAGRDHTKAHLFFETIYMNNSGDRDVGPFDDFTAGLNHASTWNENFLTRLANACGFSTIRRRDLEAKSVHSWIGVLHLECTKIDKPCGHHEFNGILSIFRDENKWTSKYKGVYG